MGSLCCCFHVRDVEESTDSNSLNHRNRLDNFVQNLMNKYEALFARGEVRTTPTSDQGVSSSNSSVLVNNSSNTNRPHRYTRSQHNVVISGSDKGTDHSRVGPETLRGCTCQLIPNLLGRIRKPIGSHCEGASKECGAESSVKPIVETYTYFSSEDEDEDEDDCPTCLEEYTPENPKIMTKCSHHYHLSCILEWMERSEICPVCGKIMEFDETT